MRVCEKLVGNLDGEISSMRFLKTTYHMLIAKYEGGKDHAVG